jgi:2-polyprenyl-6-methoxyphenol hydroxylase-like FAD-dependent oxidoreductase
MSPRRAARVTDRGPRSGGLRSGSVCVAMSTQTIREPERRTPILKRTQVLVVGGGSAGVSAAVAAARAGAEVTLVERYGSLGGLATGGLIALLLTLDDGRGRQVIGGLCQELTERMTAAGGAFHPPKEEWGSDDAELVAEYFRWGLVWGGSGAHHRVRYAVAFDPEVMRQVLAELVQEAGVDLLFHMWAADAIVEGERVRGVSFQSKAGRQAILADVVIDASGDGDVLASAGCAFELEKIYPWLWFRMGGVSDVSAALEAGGGFFRTPNPGVVLLPWGSVARIERKIDPTDPRDLTFAELECRRMVMEEVQRLKQSVPEMAQAHICNIATQIGITESRRLVGRHVLTRDDMDTGFDDAVCITGHWTKYGVVYAVPYRCLQTRERVNLLAAGRIISVDHRVHQATKEIPACMAVGQAAGVAAVLALDSDGDVCAVDAALLRRRLVAGGALLDYFS